MLWPIQTKTRPIGNFPQQDLYNYMADVTSSFLIAFTSSSTSLAASLSFSLSWVPYFQPFVQADGSTQMPPYLASPVNSRLPNSYCVLKTFRKVFLKCFKPNRSTDEPSVLYSKLFLLPCFLEFLDPPVSNQELQSDF